MIDLTLPWCTYRTEHVSTPFYYEGKGKTAKVSSGEYKGSGIRFKLSLTFAGFELETWISTILSTHATEAEAYAAEAILVPLASLADPYRMNMSAGGQVLRQNHSLLYKKHNAAKKKIRVAATKKRAAEKKATEAAKLKALKAELKARK